MSKKALQGYLVELSQIMAASDVGHMVQVPKGKKLPVSLTFHLPLWPAPKQVDVSLGQVGADHVFHVSFGGDLRATAYNLGGLIDICRGMLSMGDPFGFPLDAAYREQIKEKSRAAMKR